MTKDNLLPAVFIAASLLAWPGLIAPLADMQWHENNNPGLEATKRKQAWEGLFRLLPGLPGALPLQLHRPL